MIMNDNSNTILSVKHILFVVPAFHLQRATLKIFFSTNDIEEYVELEYSVEKIRNKDYESIAALITSLT